MLKRSAFLALVLAGAVFATGSARAAELRVLSTHAVEKILDVAVPEFERSTGHKVSFGWDPAGALRRQIDAGAVFDVAIVTKPIAEDLASRGTIDGGSITPIARSGLGVAVRKGLPKPDISTSESFKQALLGARSVIRSTEGASGQYFAKLIDRLGIAEQMKDKTRLGPSGRVAEFAARGEVDMAVQQISELLPVAGVDFVGPFPPELQLYTVFTAGVSSQSKQPEAAKAFLAAISAPGLSAILQSHGLEPAPRD